MNTNFIASAGTGKTHALVEKVFEKMLSENVNITDMLVLTFTDNAATELKNRISEKILEHLTSQSLEYQKKVHLHKQLLFLDSAYVGTFHTVFLKLMKIFPLHSKIDDSFVILSDQELSDFFDLMFEKWSLQDFNKDRESWENMIEIVKNRDENIKRIFKKIYQNRLKISFQDQDQYQKLVDQKFEETKQLYDELMEKYRENFVNIWKLDKSLSFLDPHEIGDMLEKKDLIGKKIPEKILDLEEKKEDSKNLKIQKLLENLKVLKQHQSYILFLKKFKNFLEFFSNQKQNYKFLDFDDIMEKMRDTIQNKEIAKLLREKFRYIFVDEFQDTDKIQIEILKFISNNNLYLFGDPKQSIYTWRQADLDTYFEFIKDFKQQHMEINYRSTQNLVDFYNRLFCGDIFFENKNVPSEYRKPLKSDKGYQQESSIELIDIILENNMTVIFKKENIKIQAYKTASIISQLLKKGANPNQIMILFRKNEDLYEFQKILSEFSIPVYTQANINFYEEPEARFLLNVLKAIDNPTDNVSLLSVLLSKFVDVPIETVYNHRQNLLDIDHNLIKLIKELNQNKNSLSLVDILEQIYEKVVLNCNHYCNDTLKKFNNLKNKAIIKSKEGYLLKDFILYLENSEEKIKIGSEDNAVKLLTMHSAKGLQSEIVIIPLIDLYPYINGLDDFYVYENKPVVNLSSYNIKSIILSDKRIEEHLKKIREYEERRLFYVALTRAQKKLIMIATQSLKKRGSSNSLYRIIYKHKDALQINYKQERVITKIHPKHKLNHQTITNQPVSEEKISELSKIYNTAKNTRRFISVSELMKIEESGDSNQINYIENSQENIGLYTGIVVHEVLETIDFKTFSQDDVLAFIKERQNLIPENIREIVVSNTVELMKKFENSEILTFLKSSEILHRELPFTLFEEGRFIEGRIDLVVKRDGMIYVIDYKTNRFSSDDEKKKIIDSYKTQKRYYMQAVSRLYNESNLKFFLGLIYSGELIEIS